MNLARVPAEVKVVLSIERHGDAALTAAAARPRHIRFARLSKTERQRMIRVLVEAAAHAPPEMGVNEQDCFTIELRSDAAEVDAQVRLTVPQRHASRELVSVWELATD